MTDQDRVELAMLEMIQEMAMQPPPFMNPREEECPEMQRTPFRIIVDDDDAA